MYINLWYVAAFSTDLAGTPLKVRMLGRDFVLFRDKNNRAVCLSNVCIHRGASLSQGKCHGDDTVECPQHGWRFGADGRCKFIPSQPPNTTVPAAAHIDSYPTAEAHGLIWAFLGDDPANAPPIPPMPECDIPGWRSIPFGEVWTSNFHWAKFSNLDLTHVPITHGQKFVGCFSPKEQITRHDNYSISSRVVTPFEQPKGNWQDVRETTGNIVSTLTFFASGLTTKGHLEIGGDGSGIFVTFYEMITPIDAETSQMRYLFLRNFMAEPQHDEGHLQRNLKNVREDRAIAETQLPKRGPTLPTSRDVLIDPDDTLVKGYWDIMQRLRDHGHEIDLAALDAADRGHRYCAIPSPARETHDGAWVHDRVPTLSARLQH